MKLVSLLVKTVFLSLVLISNSNADAAINTGIVESVKMYDECALITLKDNGYAFVFPMEGVTSSGKLSVALSALHTGDSVEMAFWGTSGCSSVDAQASSAPTGTRVYLYSISVTK